MVKLPFTCLDYSYYYYYYYSCVRYRYTRRRRERQRRGTYAMNVKLQESATAVASPVAVANDNWTFMSDVNTSSPSFGHDSLPRNKYEHAIIARPQTMSHNQYHKGRNYI